MPVVVKAKKNDSYYDLIKRFKKAVSANEIVQKVKDRRYHQKPSKIKSAKTSERNRLRKRLHSLKKMKNVSQNSLERIIERMNSTR